MSTQDSYRADDIWGPPRTPEEPPAPPPEPIHPTGGLRDLARKAAAPLAGAGLLALKFGAKLKGLALLLPKAPMLLSMVVSVGAYSLIFGWAFAVLFVLLLLVHELGHVWELRRQGVPATAPLFIPFLGAVVGMKGLPADVYREARVGLAGPVIGSLGAAVVAGIGVAIDSNLLQAAGYTGFFLNLFNLLPFGPLDGGRAVAAIHPALWLAGLIGMVALLFIAPNPILILILVVGGLDSWRRFRDWRRGTGMPEGYYSVSRRQRLTVAAVYLGLAALLVVGMDLTFIDHNDL